MSDAIARNDGRLLEEVLDLLRTLRDTGAAEACGIEPSRIDPLERLAQDRGYFRNDVVRVVLIGEFKAGKSTIVNAMLRRRVAAADLFEMTSWVARYWPSEEEFCRIHRFDGTDSATDVTEFYEACQNRTMDKAVLSSIESVDIGLETDVPFSLIDCPGLGAATRENEQRMLRALQDADAVVWTVDVESIGGQRESALIQRLVSSGMPLLAVLTKCDLLSGQDEVDEIRDYVARTFGIKPEFIFATSAEVATAAGFSGESVQESGVQRLSDHISSDLAVREKETRAVAQRAHEREMASLATSLLDEVDGHFLEAEVAAKRFKDITDTIQRAVQIQLEQEIEEYVRAGLLGDQRDAISADLASKLRMGGGALSDMALQSAFRQHLGADYMDGFWRGVADKMVNSAAEIWAAKIQESSDEIEGLVAELSHSLQVKISSALSSNDLDGRLSEITSDTMKIGGLATIGAAGTAWAISAAGSATAGAALLSAGLPVLALGVGITAAVIYMRKGEFSKNAESRADMIIDKFMSELIERELRPKVFPKMKDLNRQIADDLVEQFHASLVSLPRDVDPYYVVSESRRLGGDLRRAYAL